MYGFVERYKKSLMKFALYDQIVLLKIYVDDLNQAGYIELRISKVKESCSYQE